jgi:hypothetical protein
MWRIKEFMQLLKTPTKTETIVLHRLYWFGNVEKMEGSRIPRRV